VGAWAGTSLAAAGFASSSAWEMGGHGGSPRINASRRD
jgi:hypothetical protein